MRDYLTHLAARALNLIEVLQPRPVSLYEPQFGQVDLDGMSTLDTTGVVPGSEENASNQPLPCHCVSSYQQVWPFGDTASAEFRRIPQEDPNGHSTIDSLQAAGPAPTDEPTSRSMPTRHRDNSRFPAISQSSSSSEESFQVIRPISRSFPLQSQDSKHNDTGRATEAKSALPDMDHRVPNAPAGPERQSRTNHPSAKDVIQGSVFPMQPNPSTVNNIHRIQAVLAKSAEEKQQTIPEPAAREVVHEQVKSQKASRLGESIRSEDKAPSLHDAEGRAQKTERHLSVSSFEPGDIQETHDRVLLRPNVRSYVKTPTLPATQPAPEPSVQVSIGCIEVRATQTPSSPPESHRSMPAIMSLDDYLRQRSHGGR